MIILVDWYFLELMMDMVHSGTGMLILMCELAPQTLSRIQNQEEARDTCTMTTQIICSLWNLTCKGIESTYRCNSMYGCRISCVFLSFNSARHKNTIVFDMVLELKRS